MAVSQTCQDTWGGGGLKWRWGPRSGAIDDERRDSNGSNGPVRSTSLARWRIGKRGRSPGWVGVTQSRPGRSLGTVRTGPGNLGIAWEFRVRRRTRRGPLGPTGNPAGSPADRNGSSRRSHNGSRSRSRSPRPKLTQPAMASRRRRGSTSRRGTDGSNADAHTSGSDSSPRLADASTTGTTGAASSASAAARLDHHGLRGGRRALGGAVEARREV